MPRCLFGLLFAGVAFAQQPELLRPDYTPPDAGSPIDTLLPAQAQTPAAGPDQGGDGGYDNGNDPSKVRKRFTFRSDTNRFGNGLWVTTNTASASFPILNEGKLKANFGFDVPMNYYQVAQPSATLSGLGDLKANVMFIRPLTPRVTGLFGVNL